MRELLEQAVAAIEKLPADVQDAVATRLLAEAADEQAWAAQFAATTDAQWDRMAETVRQPAKNVHREGLRGSVEMASTSIKQEAHRLVEGLPENATWDDLMHQIYVRQAIEAGLADSEAGRTVDVQEVRARFGLSR